MPTGRRPARRPRRPVSIGRAHARRELAGTTAKDARLVELILRESSEVLRARPNVLIVRHRLGLVLANAGIDQSNVDHGDGEAAEERSNAALSTVSVISMLG